MAMKLNAVGDLFRGGEIEADEVDGEAELAGAGFDGLLGDGVRAAVDFNLLEVKNGRSGF